MFRTASRLIIFGPFSWLSEHTIQQSAHCCTVVEVCGDVNISENHNYFFLQFDFAHASALEVLLSEYEN